MSDMKLRLGFSTCPNDTFIFEPLVTGRIDAEGLQFEPGLADVEDLNRKAFDREMDITKLSYAAYGYVSDDYVILDSGSALGRKNGPLLLSRSEVHPGRVTDLRIAIPGKYTTANLLFDIAFPSVKEKKEYLFSDIEDAILSGEVDAGLAIHENRFTYQKRGLYKIMDLGDYWEERSGVPVPLGGIMIKRDLPGDVISRVNRILKRSVAFAMAHPEVVMHYVRHYAQEMDDAVMQKHIGLYVNAFTRDLGPTGQKAIRTLYDHATRLRVLPDLHPQLFVSDLEAGTK